MRRGKALVVVILKMLINEIEKDNQY